MHKLEYKLKFLLDSTTLRILSIKDISDSKQIIDFTNAYGGVKKIQGFCTQIGKTTRVPVMNVPIDKKSKIHKVIFCEAAAGKSVFVSQSYADSCDVPAGADSLITNGQNNIGYLSEQGADIKKCEYVLKDAKKILPLYEIEFEYDEEFESKSRGRCLCNRCTEREAVVFCPSERASFCEECDAAVHHDSFLKRHDRKYFAEVGQKKFVCCAQHPCRVNEYFCTVCCEPICAECKITGNHSKGEMGQHKIQGFLDACQFASATIKEENKAILKFSESAERALGAFDEAVSNTKSNFNMVRKQLEREFKTLMLQVDSMENYQRQLLNAAYVERQGKAAILKNMAEYPEALDRADLLDGFKVIMEQCKNEKPPVFGELKFEKAEFSGKITLSQAADHAMRKQTEGSLHKTSVTWHVENTKAAENGFDSDN
ncbi:hypothetical protein ENBRE01_2040 [Enteropsectra breve]|nr:hypothetical protein ENBRE01_2040 [Enteropsectra breve]